MSRASRIQGEQECPPPPGVGRHVNQMMKTLSVNFVFLAVVMSGSASAYLNAPAEKLTLPELLKEFKSIQIVKAGRMDLDKGVILWQHVEQLQGEKDETTFKHLLKLKDGVPEALKELKPDQTAVFFSQDGWHRGLVLTEKCWYVVDYEADNQVWRITYTDRWYDFNVAFAGSPAELIAAIRTLLKGDEAIVNCHVKPKEPALQSSELIR